MIEHTCPITGEAIARGETISRSAANRIASLVSNDSFAGDRAVIGVRHDDSSDGGVVGGEFRLHRIDEGRLGYVFGFKGFDDSFVNR